MPVAAIATLLHALRRGDDDGALRLLSSWPPHDPALRQFRTDAGETLLHFAAYGRSGPEVLRMLLARGVDLRGVTRTGASPLHYALQGAMRASTAALQWLLHEGGPALREMADADGRTALMAAVLGDHADAVALLLECEASVRTHDNIGNTALHMAAAIGSGEVVDALLAADADVNARNKAGITPLMLAAGEGRRENLLRLLLAEADVDAADGRGGTPLMYAVANGHAGIADVLLSGDAAWYPNNDDGWNAMTLAARGGNAEVLQVLIEHGVNPEVRDGAGRLACEIALQRGLTQLERSVRGRDGR
jgi:ankyrin repeat protein